MEPRPAPQWIREAERRYRRARVAWAWVSVAAMVALGWMGLAFSGALSHASWQRSLALLCVIVLVSWRPDVRARRYGAAARLLSAAITEYQASPLLAESTLAEADRRAREALHVERIRDAPGWIRDKRRHYRLRILGWLSPALLAPAFAMAAPFLRWPWLRPWHESAATEGDLNAADRAASGVLAGPLRGV